MWRIGPVIQVAVLREAKHDQHDLQFADLARIDCPALP
jgi:hypothetical protein